MTQESSSSDRHEKRSFLLKKSWLCLNQRVEPARHVWNKISFKLVSWHRHFIFYCFVIVQFTSWNFEVLIFCHSYLLDFSGSICQFGSLSFVATICFVWMDLLQFHSHFWNIYINKCNLVKSMWQLDFRFK